ncbi:MAG: transposase [Gammaproteobacteria bacterium]|nr:MAG: transposase [Gammaproteobacteria bacterium]TLZ27950.1 MAG: transposase [Gammaproteobacteria bacterium]TLZ60207.1 MAG: transposase [Gammaproteobacteria bacterium]
MGTKRDLTTLKELERRRRLAAELLRQGVRPAEVARWVKSSRQSVMRWSRLLEQDGLRGLRRAERVGRPPVLTDPQLKRLAKLLKAGAVAAGYATETWKLPRIAVLIQREFGVRLATSSVWRTLQQMGWSVQRTGRVWQQNPAGPMRSKQTR